MEIKIAGEVPGFSGTENFALKQLRDWPLHTVLPITHSSKFWLRQGQWHWKADSEMHKCYFMCKIQFGIFDGQKAHGQWPCFLIITAGVKREWKEINKCGGARLVQLVGGCLSTLGSIRQPQKVPKHVPMIPLLVPLFLTKKMEEFSLFLKTNSEQLRGFDSLQELNQGAPAASTSRPLFQVFLSFLLFSYFLVWRWCIF